MSDRALFGVSLLFNVNLDSRQYNSTIYSLVISINITYLWSFVGLNVLISMSFSLHLAGKYRSSFTTLAGRGQARQAAGKLPPLGSGVERINLRRVDSLCHCPLACRGPTGVNQANYPERAPPQWWVCRFQILSNFLFSWVLITTDCWYRKELWALYAVGRWMAKVH